jgi:protein-tyrosine-phosphatase/DNA-binding transcriptional ArsR family regulator
LAEERLKLGDIVGIFDSLAQPTRLEAYRLLLRYLPYGLPAGDIARLLAVPHNTLSTHMAQLERAGLVMSRREGRSIIYAASASKLGDVLRTMLADLGASLNDITPPAFSLDAQVFPQKRPTPISERIYNVLVLCTGNSARSIMAEAILRREGGGRFRAFSAGSKPAERPDPLAMDLLGSLGYDVNGFQSKSWHEFVKPAAPRMDFIITVCDDISGKTCPHWPDHPFKVHWGLSDPAAVRGTDVEKRAAFMDAYRRLSVRLTAFVNLPFETLDLATLKSRLIDIGTMDGATELTLAGRAA